MVARLTVAGTPPTKSSARQKLAEEIAQNKQAIEDVAKLEVALSSARRRWMQAIAALDKAKAAATEAVKKADEHVLNEALGEAGPVPLSIKDAQAAVESAEHEEKNANHAADLIRREIQTIRDRGSFRDGTLSRAVEQVIRTDPAVERFLLAYAEKQAEFLDWTKAVEVLRLRLSGDQLAMIRADNRASCPVADAWRASLARLRDDPDAELPSFPVPITEIRRVIVNSQRQSERQAG